MKSVTVLIALLVIAGCGNPSESGSRAAQNAASPPTDEPFVRGVVVSLKERSPVTEGCVPFDSADANDDGSVGEEETPFCQPSPSSDGLLLISGRLSDEGQGGEVYIQVKKNAQIAAMAPAHTYHRATFSDLREGDLVDVWITGVVQESAPPIARATFVLMKDQP